MATPPFLPDESKPGASDLISLYPPVEHTFREVIEDWILWEHNTGGTHKQVTLDDISEPTIPSTLVGIWHESGVLKTRFAGGTVYDLLTTNTGLALAGGTMTGELVLSGNPSDALGAVPKQLLDLKAPLASPALTGNPTAPTQSVGNDSTRIATTAFVTAANAFLHVRDQKSSGTDGGTFTSGAWQKRTLNTSATNEISGASLGSSQITLPAGTYYIDASAGAYRVSGHKARLYNKTSSALLIMGTTAYASNVDDETTRSFIAGRFTLSDTRALEIQHRCQDTNSGDGFGRAETLDGIEVFTDVKIWKVG